MIDEIDLVEEETIDIELDNDFIILGDMLKKVYDTNNNGIVDNAEKVNNHTVDIDVPENAKFTDTIYDDTQVKQDINNLQTNKADKSEIPTVPTNISAFNNDVGYITNTVNNLTNYYLKNETFTQQEVRDLISAITTLDLQVVQTLPTQDISTTTIYLVPKNPAETNNAYDEYIYVSNNWEFIGSTEVDLTDYVKNTDYASSSTGGVIKIDSTYFGVDLTNGKIYCIPLSYSAYQEKGNSYFISKGTLENVLNVRIGDINTVLETLTRGTGV